MFDPGGSNGHRSPFLEIDRADWAALAPTMPAPLTQAEIEELRGLNGSARPARGRRGLPTAQPAAEPLRGGADRLREETTAFLRTPPSTTPFVIGAAGSVAVGKSTGGAAACGAAGALEDTPSVQLLTTDGFLFPNAELERRGLMQRKGFPESYDRRR